MWAWVRCEKPIWVVVAVTAYVGGRSLLRGGGGPAPPTSSVGALAEGGELIT